jgi:hypothetical protein
VLSFGHSPKYQPEDWLTAAPLCTKAIELKGTEMISTLRANRDQ